ncbi:putative mitochondrial protein [Vitis vinifera]|uniref:Putative mitochondrial protein n=1 Tax=Vitis vinifera TaxID=29760 RepID=A0A438EYY6_VITVI|nr:putative mitochondrial protein [Vitis vinifera]
MNPIQVKFKSFQIPKNVQDVLRVPEWRNVVLEEIRVLEKNKTWEIENLPRRKITVGCKWVFTTKYKSDGTLERYKTRLVAKGFTQTYDIDCLETFALVEKLNIVRILLSLAATLD